MALIEEEKRTQFSVSVNERSRSDDQEHAGLGDRPLGISGFSGL